jgi:acyl-CoA synthetase (AMP-forming)/AMP-acid ligase II
LRRRRRFLQYTGGTTGVSKGATLLHRNILANVPAERRWLQPALRSRRMSTSSSSSARCRSIQSSR